MNRKAERLIRKTLPAFFIFALSHAAQTFAEPTAPSAPSYLRALRDAEQVASLNESWEVVRGAGESMLPLYGDHSILVVEKGAFGQLKPGMIVVYEDSSGDLVAHQLKGREGKGWIAKGVNNRREDPGLVTENNFRGLVFGVLTASGEPPSTASPAIPESIPVVYGKKY